MINKWLYSVFHVTEFWLLRHLSFIHGNVLHCCGALLWQHHASSFRTNYHGWFSVCVNCEHNIQIWVIKHKYSRKKMLQLKITYNSAKWVRINDSEIGAQARDVEYNEAFRIGKVGFTFHFALLSLNDVDNVVVFRYQTSSTAEYKIFEICDAVYICRLSNSFIFPSILPYIHMICMNSLYPREFRNVASVI